MKILKRLKQGLPNTLLFTFGIAAAGLFTGMVLARTLLPASRGEFAVVLLWPGVLAFLGELGLGFSFSYYVGQNREHLNGLWTLALIVSLIWGSLISLIGIAVLPGIVHLSAESHSCLIWNLTTVPFALLVSFTTYFLLGANYVFEFNLLRSFCVFVYTVGILAVALSGQIFIKNYVWAYMLSQYLGCAMGVWLVVKRLNPSLRWQPELIKPVFIYGFKNYLSGLSAQLNNRLDQMLMSLFIVSKQLGFYVVAVSFSSMLMPLFSAIAIVTLPRVTHAADLNAGGRQTVRCLQIGLVIGLPVTILATLITPWLLPCIFGEKYAPSIILAQILLFGGIFQGLNLVLGNGLRGLGQPGKTAFSEGAGLIVTIVLLCWLLPVYGAWGAAVTSLSAYFLVSCMQVFFVKKAAGLQWCEFL